MRYKKPKTNQINLIWLIFYKNIQILQGNIQNSK